MSPIEILIEEHKAVKTVTQALGVMCDMLDAGVRVDPSHLEKAVAFIRGAADKMHHLKEEEILFPVMERAGVSRKEMLADVIITEHDLGRGYVRGMRDAPVLYAMGDSAAGRVISENGRSYVRLIGDHMGKEEEVIFPLAEARLPEEGIWELAREFRRIDSVVVGEDRREELMSIMSLLKARYLDSA